MGQRCYLETSFKHCLSGRWVPWAWYVVGGTPGTTAVFGPAINRDQELTGYDFKLTSPIGAARRHVVEQFDGVSRLLWAILGGSDPSMFDGKPLEEVHPQYSRVWRALRRFFTIFEPCEYLNVLRLLCAAPADHSTVTLNARELMMLGDDQGRGNHLAHWQSYVTANRLLKSAVDLDFDAMCRVMLLDDESNSLLPNDDFALRKNLVGWCRLTFVYWDSTERVAEYLWTEKQLDEMDGYDFF